MEQIDMLTSVIGPNKGKAHQRIWLQGDRLVACGFRVGQRYDRELVYLNPINKEGPLLRLSANPDGRYKVSGKGDQPIIDITGKFVDETFAGETHVTARFFIRGKIEIRGGEA